METVLAVIVLIIVLALLAGLVYAWLRASGPGGARAWLVAPAALREGLGNLLVSARDTTTRTDEPGDTVQDADWREAPDPESRGTVTLAYDETALATLRDELERDLSTTRDRQQEIDQRLHRLDLALTEMRGVPDDLTKVMRVRDRRMRRRLDQLRYEVEGVRRGATASGARRDEAYAELYTHLARIEASLATAINPMLLPGEPLHVPDEFVPESLEAESWDDVGEHAYAFGMTFNQTRLVLDPPLAADIERFLATLRQGLTGKVYPTVRRAEPTRTQLALMRSALEGIVEALVPVRRQIESAWHEMDRPSLPTEGDEPTEDPDDDDED
jgi:hypothetical protein